MPSLRRARLCRLGADGDQLEEALRLGEVLGLQWEDVDLEANKLRVRHALDRQGQLGPTKHTKLTGKRDLRDLEPIDLFPRSAEILRRRKPLNPAGYVFLNTVGKPRERRHVQRAYEGAVERAALPANAEGRVLFHSLRHSCISRLANTPPSGSSTRSTTPATSTSRRRRATSTRSSRRA